MRYSSVVSARFLSRPNRFIAHVELDGTVETVHVKNTGRCRELLVPGAAVYLSSALNPTRKTRYDLIAVEKVLPNGKPLLINMDSQVVNEITAEWLDRTSSPDVTIRREVPFGSSRFDFQLTEGDRQTYLEVKGVTLEDNGIVRFPDAPTLRGTKHLRELIRAKELGFGACVLFVVQMNGVRVFRPNEKTDPAFAAALREAAAAGVEIRAMDCLVTPDSISIDQEIPVELTETGS